MLSRLGTLFGGQRIGDLHRLEELVASETARLAQKSTTGYCRTKAGLNVELLFKEKGFLELVEVCRWNGFAVTLADMLLILEGFLRPVAEASGRLAPLDAWLLDFHARHIGQYVHPERSWDADRDEMRQRLARARLAPPIPAANVGFDSAKRIWDWLPVHPRLRVDDFELVQNCLRFGHVSFRQELERRVDPAAIVAALPGANRAEA
jgi:hypothetical protein